MDYAPGHRIILLHFFDDTLLFRTLIMYNLLVIPDVLDPERLHTSISRLVQREGWEKLGARLRQGKGCLEYHIPEAFDASRPPVAFTYTNHDMISANHPSASRVPRPDDGLTCPSIVGDPEELADLVYPPDCPKSLDDWLKTDRPILGLHITSFLDKTMIVVYWPHLAMDALGQRALFDAWMKMLQGHEETISTPIGVDRDPLAEVGKHPTEPHVLAPRRLMVSSMTLYGLRNIFSLGCSAKEARMICIPAVCWQKWHSDAREDLGPNQFLTEGDIITAFWMRISTAHLGASSDKTVTTNIVMSLRKILGDEELPAGHPYISNALGFANVVLPASEIATKPLSWVALQIRQAITIQGTRAQHEAYLAMQRNSWGKLFVLFGDSAMYHMTLSNWQKANMFDLDFSAAAAKSRGGRQLMPEYIQTSQIPVLPDIFPVIGKDHKGNYWVSGYRPSGLWNKVEEELKKYAFN